MIQCSRCHAGLTAGSMFCSRCGLAFAQPVPPEEPQLTLPRPLPSAALSTRPAPWPSDAATLLWLVFSFQSAWFCSGYILFGNVAQSGLSPAGLAHFCCALFSTISHRLAAPHRQPRPGRTLWMPRSRKPPMRGRPSKTLWMRSRNRSDGSPCWPNSRKL